MIDGSRSCAGWQEATVVGHKVETFWPKGQFHVDNDPLLPALWVSMTLCHVVSGRPLVPRPAVAIGGGIELIAILPV